MRCHLGGVALLYSSAQLLQRLQFAFTLIGDAPQARGCAAPGTRHDNESPARYPKALLTDLVGQLYRSRMARRIPADRLEQLVDCATTVFIDQGYRHTQMADVAEALGLAKGTLYLYVESKEALFDLVCRYADTPRPFVRRPALPVRTPRSGATLKYVRNELARNQVLPGLSAGPCPPPKARAGVPSCPQSSSLKRASGRGGGVARRPWIPARRLRE